jgi:hypothetical protein
VSCPPKPHTTSPVEALESASSPLVPTRVQLTSVPAFDSMNAMHASAESNGSPFEVALVRNPVPKHGPTEAG